MSLRTELTLGLLFGLTACGARWEDEVAPDSRAILDAPASLEILTLVPFPSVSMKPLEEEEEAFHDYRVIDRQELDDEDVRAELIALIREGIEGNDDMAAMCFNPRHGISATRDGRRVDLVICFECLQIQMHGPDGKVETVLTTDEVEPEVSRLYREAGLSIHSGEDR